MSTRTWSEQQDDCLMNSEARAIGSESNVGERDAKSAFIEAMEKPLPPGMFKGPHYDCERNAARLQREKHLLHERVEELENPKLTHTKFGFKLVHDAEYEWLTTDAELGRLVRKMPEGFDLTHEIDRGSGKQWSCSKSTVGVTSCAKLHTPEEALRAAGIE